MSSLHLLLWLQTRDHCGGPMRTAFALIGKDIWSELQIDELNAIPSLQLSHQLNIIADSIMMDHQIRRTISTLSVSPLDGDERIPCNAQQRKPIDDYKLRCSDFGEPLLAIEQAYREMDLYRRSVSCAQFKGK